MYWPRRFRSNRLECYDKVADSQMTTSNSSIPLPKHWKILRPCLPSIVQTSGGDVSMASHSCTLAMSASCERALVAAVARIECTQRPLTSILRPVSCPYFLTTFRYSEFALSGRSSSGDSVGETPAPSLCATLRDRADLMIRLSFAKQRRESH